MSKMIKMRRYLFLLAVLFLSINSSPLWAADTITITVIDYCPHQCYPEKSQGRWGYMAEVTRDIFERAGMEVVFKRVPFKRAIVGVEEGKYDAIHSANASHSSVILFSKKLSGVLRQVFYVKKGNTWRYDDFTSLEQIDIGSVVGYDYSASCVEYQTYLEKHKDDYKKVQYLGGETAPLKNFKKILLGRITTFNEDSALASYLLMKEKNMALDEFEEAGSLEDNPQYMGFSPHNPHSHKYRDIFDTEIQRMRENGELKNILDSYGVQDWGE